MEPNAKRTWDPSECVFGTGWRSTLAGGVPVLLVPYVEGGQEGYSLMIERTLAARFTGALDIVFREAEHVLQRHERSVVITEGGDK